MKTVQMTRDFCYHPKHNVAIKYLGGATYSRVPEYAVSEILRSNAGRVVPLPSFEDLIAFYCNE